MAQTLYELGYSDIRRLRRLADSVADAEAVDRLDRFRGTAADVRRAAKLYRAAGDDERADQLLAFL